MVLSDVDHKYNIVFNKHFSLNADFYTIIQQIEHGIVLRTTYINLYTYIEFYLSTGELLMSLESEKHFSQKKLNHNLIIINN